MTTINLISLNQGKLQLHVTNPDHDADILFKITQASQIVLDHMKLGTVPAEWLIGSPATTIEAPENVKALTCLVLGSLYFQREGDVFEIPAHVWNLVERKPTLA